MIIGVPKEIKIQEYRVGMVPGGVKTMTDRGHEVFVEKGAGLGAGFSDEEYVKAGAVILDSAEEVWKKADMVVKVQEPIEPEYKFFREDLVLYTYLHLAAEPVLTRKLAESGVLGIAYETVQLEDGSLPLLVPMSEVAGKLATQVGAHYLKKELGGKGVLLGGIPGVRRGHVVILGGGVVGTCAAKVAMGLGADVTILDINKNRLIYLDDVFGNALNTVYSNPYTIAEEVSRADLLVGAVLIPGARAPHLVTREMISEMEAGSVVVDVAIDQGGCIETIKPTSHDDPVYVDEGVVHYGVTNMPGSVARTSTLGLTNATLQYAVELADKGAVEVISNNPAVAKGVNTYKGMVTYKAVAEATDMEYRELSSLL